MPRLVPLENLLAKHQRELQGQAAKVSLPDDLAEQVTTLLEHVPEMSWDQAIAEIMQRR